MVKRLIMETKIGDKDGGEEVGKESGEESGEKLIVKRMQTKVMAMMDDLSMRNNYVIGVRRNTLDNIAIAQERQNFTSMLSIVKRISM
jgi:hypothetical protein